MKNATFYAAAPPRSGKNRQRLRGTALGIVFLMFSGCTMAPSYTRPEAPVPANWPSGPAYPATNADTAAQPAAATPWRSFFVDPQLQQVIELALANNRDLKLALLNVEKFRALYQIERSQLLPHVNATAGGNLQRVPATLSGTGKSVTRRQYSAGVGVSAYELDLFGRVRSLKDQALEEYLATEEAQRAAQISLIAAVVDSYLTLAADREQLALSRQTLESQKTSFDLTQKRFNAGVSSALDVHQAQTTVETARIQSATYTRLAAQDENQLTLLVGAPLPIELLPEVLAAEATLVQELPPGLPAETLLSRPDILQAEHHLIGANANIGAARAAFFPSITLTGSVGVGSDQLSGLFKAGSGTWGFAPQITLPIFDAGRNRANLKAANVEREIAVAEYEKAIQTAFREVADALAERGTIDEQLAAQQSLTDATTQSQKLAEARYQRGVDSYLVLLDAQRTLFIAQQNLIATRLSRLNNRVTLYKVLGGGAE